MSKRNPAEVVIHEARGKRIEELAVTEPYANSDELYVTIRFDDDTEISLELSARIRFGVNYTRVVDGEQVPIKQQAARFLAK
jgi:hypothetical protein